MIAANNPKLTSWIAVPADSDFPIQNLPFGIIKKGDNTPKAASIIGDQVINLDALHQLGYFSSITLPEGIFNHHTLNGFIALGKSTTNAVRERLSEIFQKDNAELRDNAEGKSSVLTPVGEVDLLMPVHVGDYTDFYSSEQHATNVGTMFRDPDNALLPNWKHIPVGYHGRASSIVVSGTDLRRPKGQTMEPEASKPSFGPTKRLDFELEMAFVTGKVNELGNSITPDEADEYIFGFTLFNDWSARDIQKWEYVPLGPFLAKNFGSSISPWIVTMEALEPFKVAGPVQEPEVLPYLKYTGKSHFDINLEVFIQPEGSTETCVARSNFRHMYWNVRQQLAHHTVNGCNINVGDMYASGTISGPTPDAYGSMLELAWKGTKPLMMPDGTERKFIHDGDEVTMRGYGEKDGVRIGFGEVRTKILPAK
ncbi:fumarylacetoacetase [Marinoscillum sp.]|uniref:fumarylacetoacetase n=1 Tax=Marinoscillum sp. TaxID=2024838 RepID=UPI003BACA76C